MTELATPELNACRRKGMKMRIRVEQRSYKSPLCYGIGFFIVLAKKSKPSPRNKKVNAITKK